MPVQCQHCNDMFDLHDGCSSTKWYLNTVICYDCNKLEETEVEKDEEIAELKTKLEDAVFDVNQYCEQLAALGCKTQLFIDRDTLKFDYL